MRKQADLRPLTRILLTALIALGISVLTFWLSSLIAGAVQPARPATCLAEGCFCEAGSGEFPEQLANAISSFAFVLVGVWALVSTREPPIGTRERVLKPPFAATMLLIGISSFFYHATLSFTGQFLDIFSMYAFGLLLLFGALYRSGHLSGRWATVLFIVLSAALAAVQYVFPEARRVLFALILLPGIVLELTPFVTGHGPRSPKVRFLYLGVGVVIVAYAIWLLDQNRLLCSPESIIQGHAVWHMLTAVAAYMIMLHYRHTPHGR